MKTLFISLAVLGVVGLCVWGQTSAVVGGLVIPTYPGVNSGAPAFTTTTLAMSATDDKIAFIVQVGTACNVSEIGFRTSTVTTGATLDVRLETVSTTTGDPTGTLWGTTTNANQVIADADDNVYFRTTLTANATVAVGDVVAAVFVNPGTPGNLQIAGYTPSSDMGFPYSDRFVSAAWTKNASAGPVVSLKCSTGAYIPIRGAQPATTLSAVTFNNGSTPDIQGMRFRLPGPVSVSGGWLQTDLDGDAVVKIVSGAATVAASGTFDGNQRLGTAARFHWVLFTGQAALAANTYYRYVIEPNSATSMTIYKNTYADAAMLDTMAGGQDFHWTSAKDPAIEGDWTQDLASRLVGGIVVSAIGNGSGAGGSYVFANVFKPPARHELCSLPITGVFVPCEQLQ